MFLLCRVFAKFGDLTKNFQMLNEKDPLFTTSVHLVQTSWLPETKPSGVKSGFGETGKS